MAEVDPDGAEQHHVPQACHRVYAGGARRDRARLQQRGAAAHGPGHAQEECRDGRDQVDQGVSARCHVDVHQCHHVQLVWP